MQALQTLKKRGSEFSSCSAVVPSGQVGAKKHLMEVPMSITAFLASEEALKPCKTNTHDVAHCIQCERDK